MPVLDKIVLCSSCKTTPKSACYVLDKIVLALAFHLCCRLFSFVGEMRSWVHWSGLVGGVGERKKKAVFGYMRGPFGGIYREFVGPRIIYIVRKVRAGTVHCYLRNPTEASL